MGCLPSKDDKDHLLRRNNSLNSKDMIKLRTEKIEDEYTIGRTIGEGDFGKVKVVTHKKTNQVRAVKILSKSRLSREANPREIFLNEFVLLKETDHPHIVQIYEVFEDERFYFIVTELLTGGEVYEKLKESHHISESLAVSVVRQVLLALNYCHKRGIVHRDIKPENILFEKVDDNSNVKVIDFGFATAYDSPDCIAEYVSSPLYSAPEILSRRQRYNEKCDIWSLGVVTYTVLCGHPPFPRTNRRQMYERVTQGPLQFEGRAWDFVSKEAKGFVASCLQVEPDKRPSAEKLLEHPWMQKKAPAPEMPPEVKQEIVQNLVEFQNTSKFQRGVVAFISSFSNSRKEIKLLREVFKEIDLDRNGTLCTDELKQGLKKTLGVSRYAEIDELVRRMDVDKDGVIDYSEFLIATVDKERLVSKENLSMAFQLLDRDGNGGISLDEIKLAFESDDNHKNSELWERVLGEIDKNEDGLLSLEEFVDIMTPLVGGGVIVTEQE